MSKSGATTNADGKVIFPLTLSSYRFRADFAPLDRLGAGLYALLERNGKHVYLTHLHRRSGHPAQLIPYQVQEVSINYTVDNIRTAIPKRSGRGRDVIGAFYAEWSLCIDCA